MLLMQRGVRLRCLPWSVALTFCARLHIFLMLFGYFFNGAALGSPCLGLALGLPYELVCTLFQYFLVILASKASPMQRGARQGISQGKTCARLAGWQAGPAGSLACWPVDWLAGRPVGWLAGWLDRLTGWLTGCLVGCWLAGWQRE
jgi:hypothetical protein